MATIIWFPVVLEDVDTTAKFIARDSADNASLFINRLISMTDKLEQWPDIG